MNSFGRIFRIQIFGESHNLAVGIVIDGCPPGIKILEKDFIPDIERRKGGKVGTTARKEDDIPQIISGVFNDYSTGSPITIIFNNKDVKSDDYNNLVNHNRPGHADFTAKIKYDGFNDYRGGGHFSGRLTLPIVAAGSIAKKILKNISINAKLIEAGGIRNIDIAIENAIKTNNTIGGIVECVAKGIPVGYGEPFFDSVESVISHLAFAIPAIKGIEFGNGFRAVKNTGMQQNDVFVNEKGKTKTNNCGGILGGITNGNELIFRVAVKPASSISVSQNTFNFEENKIKPLEVKGRHDACIALRVPVVIEAITAIALADFKLLYK
ncbi:MAG: chorismate synthase [Bacteroidetes bacterium CG02_land_8_20_14_3_00_31_25]|nr:chorismate synthase [Bacteroidota bacterium]PIV60913.1 MAG: chorismate synthase [Bacteroidetes bacterium CG02_land_8_20_14_3_00_31_25]PIX32441.1 MAG: chorismate synthase [Bacteroidetes bacterium CG_4_8_14_3_um_filter_31_14]PIY04670.1 MAG: chorismate synthase [Bacteroidetes bacterium CG_4_10_14_3_um_filter_31_20]